MFLSWLGFGLRYLFEFLDFPVLCVDLLNVFFFHVGGCLFVYWFIVVAQLTVVTLPIPFNVTNQTLCIFPSFNSF